MSFTTYPRQYIATFHGVKGRWLVEPDGYGYSGQRIANTKQQAKYGNHPDPYTGLVLYESYRMFGARQIKTLRTFDPPGKSTENPDLRDRISDNPSGFHAGPELRSWNT